MALHLLGHTALIVYRETHMLIIAVVFQKTKKNEWGQVEPRESKGTR